ncbi:hypothetical protein WI32_11460 [Burkholderia ubonensis]|nr:hypothetical protein WI30_11420 [Burkholderia ubonensis]KUZ39226.1 hypothetical protein WI32_11460 [Burkholderia ubonensis]KUZ45687.1 hypothetical protein WI33_27200 [Burkholderia ubonensis]KUZ60695.1 hypothetical protein WI34_12900 [Burkholderia ubonensis]
MARQRGVASWPNGILTHAVEDVEIDEPWLRQWHVNAEAQRNYPPTTAIQRPLSLESDRPDCRYIANLLI